MRYGASSLFKPFILILFFLVFTGVKAADSSATRLNVGLAFRKYTGFYWVNGITAEYGAPAWNRKGVTLGLNFISSGAGSALASHAIVFYHAEGSFIKEFRTNKKVRPRALLSFGYIYADYGRRFEQLPHSALTCAFETGVSYQPVRNLNLAVTFGYNFIKGNGASGVGVIYPLFAQIKVMYCFQWPATRT
jgi:hypothetical protein